MKKIILTSSLILSLGSIAFGQKKDEIDTAKLNIGNKIVKIYTKNDEVTQITFDSKDTTTTKKKKDEDCEECKAKNKYKGHWAGIDLGAGIVNNSAFLSNNTSTFGWRELNMSFNIFDKKIPLYKEYIGITTGLGISETDLSITKNQNINFNSDSLWTTKDPSKEYNHNVIGCGYINIPLMLEINTNSNPKKTFYILAGVTGGMRIYSEIMQNSNTNNTTTGTMITGKFGLNTFKLDASARIGYKHLGLYANYALTPLFDTRLTKAVYPLTFGVSWVF